MTAIQLRVPVEGTLIINPVGGFMDGRKKNKGKKGRLTAVKNIVVQQKGPDRYVPGKPFTIAPALRGKVKVKAKKVPGVCVWSGCSAKLPYHKSKWCDTHRVKARAIAMKVNKENWKARHSAA